MVSRDAAADGKFVYCVKTTGIYCRPICKARLARRANVIFHDSPEGAERAGFRSCKRCRPNLASYDPQSDVINQACARISSTKEGTAIPTLEGLANEVGWTKSHFHRQFKRITGVTPKAYELARRNSGAERETLTTEEDDRTPSLAAMDEWFTKSNLQIDDFLLVDSCEASVDWLREDPGDLSIDSGKILY